MDQSLLYHHDCIGGMCRNWQRSLSPCDSTGYDDYRCCTRSAERCSFLNKELALFEPIAAEYRSLSVKPQISEEQRRLVVQANAYNQRKDYAGAIDRYNKTLGINPTSYPEAYFNLALLHEQQRLYTFAITYMKKYLMLVPDAPDARGAQDKIYEWETMIQQK